MKTADWILFIAFVFCLYRAIKHSDKNPFPKESPYSGDFFGKHLVTQEEEIIYFYVEKENRLVKGIAIYKDDLYAFLEETNRLEWISDYFSPRQPDGHGQKSGKLSMDQYFETVQNHELHQDCLEYLKSIFDDQ